MKLYCCDCKRDNIDRSNLKPCGNGFICYECLRWNAMTDDERGAVIKRLARSIKI